MLRLYGKYYNEAPCFSHPSPKTLVYITLQWRNQGVDRVGYGALGTDLPTFWVKSLYSGNKSGDILDPVHKGWLRSCLRLGVANGGGHENTSGHTIEGLAEEC